MFWVKIFSFKPNWVIPERYQCADGTLTGDIIIKGGGDPTLGSWRWASTREGVVLNTMVTALKKAGIKKINGRIVGDNGIFKSQSIPDGWIWQDLGHLLRCRHSRALLARKPV
jgi:D-alanyl-D-alanine carboxypeptidase